MRHNFFFLLLAISVIGTGMMFAVPALAQEVDLASFAEAAGFSTGSSITVVIARLIRTAITLVGVVAVAFIVYGGFVWMTAGGHDERLKKAKSIITNAVIGLVLVFTSFAIVSFVIKALVEATGGTSTTEDSGDGGGYTDGNSSSLFYVSSSNTQCAESLQNVQLRFVFSKNVDADTVDNGIVIAQATGASVDGTFSTSARTVTFTPSQTCDAPYETEHCFEANTAYTIVLYADVVKSSTGSSLSCTTTYPCSFEFTTGEGVDVDDPTVSMDAPEDGDSVYAGSIELLQALTTDDSGVSNVDFYVIDDEEAIYSSGVDDSTAGTIVGEGEQNAFFTDTTQEWDTQGYTTNETYDIWATGYDCAGNEDTADRIAIVLRAVNCNNEVLDEDLGETDVDCGGDTSSSYYCGACDGDTCAENAECASGQCLEGQCVTTPKIESLSPVDGAVGNLVTISGEGFGEQEGVVTFLGTESGDEIDVNAYECNGSLQWSDEEIVVQIPRAAVDGPMIVTTSDSESDRTDDEYGPLIADFDVNAIERPGLCQIAPNSETHGNSVDGYGNSFGDAQGSSTFYFTRYEASSYPSWSDEHLQVVVPNVDAGSYRGQVFTGDYVCLGADGIPTGSACGGDDDCDADAGESCATSWCSETLNYCSGDEDCGEDGGTCESIRVGSNTVAFTVTDASSDSSPIISSIDSGWKVCSDTGAHCGDDDDCGSDASCEDAPTWGPPGQYITIYGTGFGTSAGSVSFENTSSGYSAVGDTDFPEICGDDFWHDTSVTVKVPETYLTEGENSIEAVTHTLTLFRADGISSDATDFVVLDDEPGPSICDLNPSSGPLGSEVTVYGENFGVSDGTVMFYSLQTADYSLWESDQISSVIVPDLAATGPVYAQEGEQGYTSNSVNFAVGDCREDESLCSEGESCCSNGVCSQSCEQVSEVQAHYAYLFTTSITPNTPQVVVSCTEDQVSPTPWEQWSDPEDVCLTASVQAAFDMEMDQSTLTTSTVIVEKCTDESGGECNVWEAVSPSSFETDTTGFAWDPPAGGFDPDTWYRVTLLGGENIQGANGGYLEEDYQWEFTTSSSEDPCEVEEVNVRPQEYTAIEQTTVDYSAELIAANDMCVAVSCDGYTLSWESDFDGAIITNAEFGEGVCTNEVEVREETPSGDPALITATVTNAPDDPSDTGELTINFSDPEINEYFPSCATACINVEPWGEFSTTMSSATIDEDSVRLYACANSLCETSGLIEADVVDSVTYQRSTQRFYLNFVDGQTLDADTWYRIVVDGDAILSTSGVALSESGSNYGTDENRYFEDDFSWIFKTKDSDVSCAVDSISIDPQTVDLSYVGERAEFDATLTGSPDDCSAQGETLQSDLYTWEAWNAQDDPNHTGAASGDQSSQDDIVAYMIVDGAIELTSALPDSCTAACVNAGAPVTTAQGVCGNGTLEDAEECDDGGGEDGDGCSSQCLNEGSSASCGNGTVEDYEDCDDGNTTGRDGCSSVCLNDGSRSVGATCGDGVQDWAANTGGEDCDDGNTGSGDGCSSNCLLEGSTSTEDVYAICGNGEIEEGEDCDPGTYDTQGDGCSSACLNEGTSACPTSSSSNCCGNGDIETGEECDGEEGCSDDCLLAGSSYAYSIPSFCGDGDATGIGEECDASASAEFSVGDYAVAQVASGATLEVDEETGSAVSTISAMVEGVSGQANLQLECSCTTDLSCGMTGIGCGVNHCCFERPMIVEGGISPADNTEDFASSGDGYCRNTAVWVEFSQTMDSSTFDVTQDNDGDGTIDQDEFASTVYLDLVSYDRDADGDQDELDEIDDCPSGYVGSSGTPVSFGIKFWRWIKSFVLGLFGGEVNASDTFACYVSVRYEVSQNEDGTSRVYLRYSDLLEENAVYRLMVVGDDDESDTLQEGVLSQNSVTLCLGEDCQDDIFEQTFAIGEDICDLDRVVVEDQGNIEAAEYEDESVEFFSATGEEHAFIASPQTYRSGSGYEEISPLLGSYAWEWRWSSSQTDGEEDDVVASVSEEPEDASRHYVASGFNGSEQVIATATITTDELSASSTVGNSVSGTLEVRALLCENPWPSLTSSTLDFPYVEDDLPSNFSFYYCRDAGEDGTDDDLPALEDPIDVSSLASSGIVQELIFKVENSSDAIGVRVIPNEEYLSPSSWVEDQEFVGVFSETELDGYPAVSSGNTLYAAAANASSETIYPNIYIVSYNENASEEAEEIFSQILDYWRFNANIDEVSDINLCQDASDQSYALDDDGAYVECAWDGDCFDVFADHDIVCDAKKGKLTRDMRRVLDVTDTTHVLDAYGESHGHCSVTKGQSCDADEDCPGSEECVAGFPEVQSGTFVPALTNSIWSSWNASLGNDLGTALPTDPINEFYDCSQDGYDATSCWNGEQGTFICPEQSHLYGYQSVGGEAYVVYAQLESDGADYTWAYDLDAGLSDEATVYVEYPRAYAPSTSPAGFSVSPVFCDGSRWGDSSLCGDGTQGTTEACEIDDTTTIACTDDEGNSGVITVACLSDCSDYQDEAQAEAAGSECSPYGCGNGVVESGEECDDGSLNGTYGHCSDSCGVSDAFYCGDGYVAGSEQCDCGTTSTYGTVIRDTSSWAYLNSCPVSNGQYTSDPDMSCAYNCTQPGPSCGDGRVNGSEECDGDYEEWTGALCSDGITTCTSDSDCESGDTCGASGYEAAEEGRICIGGSDAGYACDDDIDCTDGTCSTNTYDLYRYRVCSSACSWPSSWTGPVGGDQQCGNGTLEGDEECDDGNSSDNDACLNTCVANVCGDDEVYIGVESCDDGELNGTTCTADYDGTCNYCDISCQYKTSSGGYCGDGIVDAGEVCDGSYALALQYYDSSTQETNETCSTYGESTTDSEDTSVTYTCRWLGVCNGGSENGEDCTLDYETYLASGTIQELSSGDDRNSCADGECTAPVCADDCGSSCPTSYEATGLLVQSEISGSSPTDSINLYSYLNANGDSPDNAALYIPACTVATKITADISREDVDLPDLDLIFVTDLSGSMAWDVEGNIAADVGERRIDYVVEAATDAIEDIFDVYADTSSGSEVRISLISYQSSTVTQDAGFTESSGQSSLLTTVEGYATSVAGSTPTGLAMSAAIDLMDSSSAAVKAIVLLSDGEPSTNSYSDSCTGSWSLYAGPSDWDATYFYYEYNDTTWAVTDVYRCAAEVRIDMINQHPEIDFYSAVLSDDETLQSLMAHESSEECDLSHGFGSLSACTTGTYAFQAQDADGIEVMYGQIVDAILGTSVTMVATDAQGETHTTTGAVEIGSDVELLFPEGFICDSAEQTIPLRNTFNGEGSMLFEDFTLTYCPYE